MPKKKKFTQVKYKSGDKGLMLLAAATALIVAFFSIFVYRSQSLAAFPKPTPNPVMTINMISQGNSGESGVATLQEINGKVKITLSLKGFSDGVPQPAHIHLGNCTTLQNIIKFPLTTVINGQSITMLDASLDQLKTLEPIAIHIHKSVAQPSMYSSCGNINL